MNISEEIASLIRRETGCAADGGYTNDPIDSGGETKWGISKRAFPNENIKNLTLERATLLMKQRYFDGPCLNLLPDPLQPFMWDYAVNSGPAIAIAALQRIVGAEVDGVLGPATLAKVATWPADALLKALVKARCQMLCNLVQKHPKDVKFIEGWIMRALSFL